MSESGEGGRIPLKTIIVHLTFGGLKQHPFVTFGSCLMIWAGFSGTVLSASGELILSGLFGGSWLAIS